MRLPAELHRTTALPPDLRALAGIAVPVPTPFLPFAGRRRIAQGRRFLRALRIAWRAYRIAWRARRDAWRRARQAAAAYRELRSLDARTLRDLGLHDSELMSVVTEMSGDADPTRVHTLRALRGLE
jgi:hypothetical protein